MGVNLLEAILAGAHGLVGGVNRRRLKKEADAKEKTALAYTQSQNAIKNQLAQDTLEFYKRPLADAAGTRAGAYADNATSNAAMRDARIKELQGRVPLALAKIEAAKSIAAGHDATQVRTTGMRGANALATEAARGGNAMDRLGRRLDYNAVAKSATEQLDAAGQHAAEARRYRALAEATYDAPQKQKYLALADGLDARADSAESIGATLLQQLQGAGQAAPADTVDAPLPGEPPDVQGATDNAIETPAAGPPQTLGAALSPQPMPTPPTGFGSAMPLTLGSAIQGSGALGQPYQPRDPLPAGAMTKVRARAKEKGIAEGSPEWNNYLAIQVADYMKRHRATRDGQP